MVASLRFVEEGGKGIEGGRLDGLIGGLWE